MPGTGLRHRDALVNETHTVPAFLELPFEAEKTATNQNDSNVYFNNNWAKA